MKKSPKFSPTTHSSKTTDKALYLINDEYNTFEHVINCLVAICEHDELQAELMPGLIILSGALA